MAQDETPIIIKKYANRRLYNTSTSSYVTLDDLATMVRAGNDFEVQDAKSGDDITHTVLTQIIFELENKTGQSMLPVPFLRQLIAFYGDQMQMIVPSFLEQTMQTLTKDQVKLRKQFGSMFPQNPMEIIDMTKPLAAVEEQTKRNMEMFQNAMQMFSPFNANGDPAQNSAPEQSSDKSSENAKKDENDAFSMMKEQIDAMQRKIDSMDK